MTLKQEQILEMQLRICRALIWHDLNYGEPVAFAQIGNSAHSLDVTALNRLLKKKFVKRMKIKNIYGRGSRPGYTITPEGIVWFNEAREVYNSLHSTTQ